MSLSAVSVAGQSWGKWWTQLQDSVFQQEEAALLSIPEVHRLFEASFVWDESSASNGGAKLLPSPHRIGLLNRYSATGNPSGTSTLYLWARVALNS